MDSQRPDHRNPILARTSPTTDTFRTRAASARVCARSWFQCSRAFLLIALSGGAFVHGLPAQNAAWLLKTNAAVTGAGVYFSDVVIPPAGLNLPHARLGDAPAFGASTALRPEQLNAAIEKAVQSNPGTNWLGAPQVLVTRRARTLTELDVIDLLKERLTADYLSQGGDLELRLSRPWNDVAVPDEPFELKVLQMPAQGVMQTFGVRFELVCGNERFGPWYVPVNASLWKDVWVALHPMKRGDVLNPEDVGRERRDVLAARNHVEADAVEVLPNQWQLTENLTGGSPLNRWSLRRKPVVYRNQLVDALVQNGALSISLKVQVLEDAIPGQSVRIRNPNTKRELQGKVNDDQTVSIIL
jgi:flagella basal body P-ring formation protein FlgA